MIRSIATLPFVSILIFSVAAGPVEHVLRPPVCRWSHATPQAADTINGRFTPPPGYKRVAASQSSFGEWLRGLPLLPGAGVVHLHDGRPKDDQHSHAAVIDIDVGRRDLQQCADAVIRLRAEYQFSVGDMENIRFKFTNGDVARYSDWRRGMRPTVKGNKVMWSKTARADESYAGFRAYLDTVFTYAGTMSLSKELTRVAEPAEVQVGDVFVDPGSPGHAVIVLDVVEHENTHRRMFLLAQSFMPAQQIHILQKSTGAHRVWFEMPANGDLVTPHWQFRAGQLKRFENQKPPAALARPSGR